MEAALIPFIWIVIFLLVVFPVKILIHKYMPASKLKDFLFKER